MQKIPQYKQFEIKFPGQGEAQAAFSQAGQNRMVRAFQISEQELAVRFLPETPGIWQYRIDTGSETLTGEFNCVPAKTHSHGPVRADRDGFSHADGTTFLPFGTTCYAWIHQPQELINKTLKSLSDAPFNKLRMCVFPKHMPYNHNEPDRFPFHKNEQGNWDISSPDFDFWNHLDDCIVKLANLGVEVDLILYHPYDRWGFATLSMADSLAYLDYCLRRLSAHPNIWWSLANEYEMVVSKTTDDWEAIGQKIQAEDLYGHPTSIHNWLAVYPKADWMTHVSVQSGELKRIPEWQKQWQLPVIIDEFGYEGNIEFGWGNLSAFEMTNRFWTCVAYGSYCTHGETFWREDEVLWWAKGGELVGKSVERIAFLKRILTETGRLSMVDSPMNFNPNDNEIDENSEHASFIKVLMAMSEEDRNRIAQILRPLSSKNDNFMLQYLERTCPIFQDLQLPDNGRYQVEVIDIWEMTRTVTHEAASGKTRVPLPGKEGMAILVSRLDGDAL